MTIDRVFEICFEGPIASGKTTCARHLKKNLGAGGFRLVHEDPYENEFFGDYYRAMVAVRAGKPVPSDIEEGIFYMAQDRFLDLTVERESAGNSVNRVSDRHVWADINIFAEGLIERGLFSPEHACMYRKKASTININYPDFLVYLATSDLVCYHRAQNRSRDEEMNVSFSHFEFIGQRYRELMPTYPGRVLTLPTDELNLESEPDDINYMLEQVAGALAKLN